MADTGKITTLGFGAGAIKYVVLDGFNPNPGGVSTLQAGLVTLGFGSPSGDRLTLFGFDANPGGGGGTGAFYIFGGAAVS